MKALWRWLSRPPKVTPPLAIRCERYIDAGLAALAAGGCSGHWLVCQRCAFEWKDRLEPDAAAGGLVWHYCPRCGVQELGSRILAEYVKGIAAEPPSASPLPPSALPPKV